MSDASATAPTPAHEALGHDGLISRTWLTAIGVFVLCEGVATLLCFLGKIDGAQWSNITEFLAASTVGGYGVANVGQRLSAALAVRGQ